MSRDDPVLLVFLGLSPVRVVLTRKPGIFGARDSQPLHVVVQGGAFHSQASGGAVGTGDDAVRLFQCSANVIPLSLFERDSFRRLTFGRLFQSFERGT